MSKNETDRQADKAPEREREREREEMEEKKKKFKERRRKGSHEHREGETIEQSDNEDGEIWGLWMTDADEMCW